LARSALSASSRSRRSAWASFDAVMSVCVPIMRKGRPAASRSITRPRDRIHFQRPSLQRTRCSFE
jgi:hypothetical protein